MLPVIQGPKPFIEVSFEVVTPVHGGGVGWDDTNGARHIRPIDPVTPIRSASVRGQLRFWWRAIHGCQSASVEEMWDREALIWGAASRPGWIVTEVQAEVLRCERVAVNKTLGGDLLYGAFALRPDDQGRASNSDDGYLTKLDCNARLRVSWSAHSTRESRLDMDGRRSIEEEVSRAVQAWLFFGGVGGRTRRGFGAVVKKGRSDQTPQQFLDDLRRRYENRSRLSGAPNLLGAVLTVQKRTERSPADAQARALKALRDFRQGPNIGRDVGPGRSKWPEADALRRLTQTASRGHRPIHPAGNVFPRGRFGMPIIFHFHKKDIGDPKDPILTPSHAMRMASPLILRPLRVGDQGYAAALLRLDVPGTEELDAIVSCRASDVQEPVVTKLDSDTATRIQPMAEHGGGAADPLTAFARFFEGRS